MDGLMEQERAESSSPQTLTVSQFSQYIHKNLPQWLPPLWISGELAEIFIAKSGHVYMIIKDKDVQFRAVIYHFSRQQMKIELSDGLHVNALVQATFYKPKGEFQLIIKSIEPQGIGLLRLEFEKLKEKLIEEGLFDISRKKPLPKYPNKIGVITSPDGAVLHDIIRVLQRRFPAIKIILYPCAVQGAEAAEQIIKQLDKAAEEHQADTYIIARGGGSLTDLWCFNMESVVRKIAAFPWPIISAIGHETDTTLTDFAADLRASTPSIAAELASPDYRNILTELSSHLRQFKRVIDGYLINLQNQHDGLERAWHSTLIPTNIFLHQLERFEFQYEKKVQQRHNALLKKYNMINMFFQKYERQLNISLNRLTHRNTVLFQKVQEKLSHQYQGLHTTYIDLEKKYAEQKPQNALQLIELQTLDHESIQSEDQITPGLVATIQLNQSKWMITFDEKLQ
ncbi:MAG: exodeoxyribonuclease VII large subunit [Gammaproteobacteria bacterium]|nr:exodeoxyribonuclease VII large subunit [Gammaproteobacteria bacterium]